MDNVASGEEWSPDRRRDLFYALVDAFGSNLSELKQLWKYELALDEALYPIGDTGTDIIDGVLGYCLGKGRHLDLESAILKVRSGNPKVKKYREKYAAQEVAESIVQIKSSPDGRALIFQFYHNDFQAARDRIYILNGYKILHDCLHNLEVSDFGTMGEGVDFFLAKTEVSKAIVEDYLSGFERYARDANEGLRNLQPLPPRDQDLEQTWVALFERSTRELRRAVNANDPLLWRSNIGVLQEICKEHPPRINGRLVVTVSEIPFDRLVTALRTIKGVLPADQGFLLRQLEKGIGGLEDLERLLNARLDDHNNWQQLDSLLRMAARSLPASQDDVCRFTIYWELIREGLEKRCRCAATVRLACELCKRMTEVTAAVDAKQFESFRATFNTLKRTASAAFLQVDRELREACGKLEPIGGVVDSLLKDPDS